MTTEQTSKNIFPLHKIFKIDSVNNKAFQCLGLDSRITISQSNYVESLRLDGKTKMIYLKKQRYIVSMLWWDNSTGWLNKQGQLSSLNAVIYYGSPTIDDVMKANKLVNNMKNEEIVVKSKKKDNLTDSKLIVLWCFVCRHGRRWFPKRI